MHSLDDWRTALAAAKCADDWKSVDEIALDLSKRGFCSLKDINSALHLALAHLGSDPDQSVAEGAASEVWIEHLIGSVWDALLKLEKGQEFFLSLPFAAHSIGRDHRIVAVSQQWCDLLGYQPSEVLGRKSIDFLTEESRRLAVEKYLPTFWQNGSISKVEYSMVHHDGHHVDVYLSAAAEYDSKGTPVRTMAILSPRKN